MVLCSKVLTANRVARIKIVVGFVFKSVIFHFVDLLLNYLLYRNVPYDKVPVPVAVRSSRSSAARLLRSWVRIPPGAWMFVASVCVVRERSLRPIDHSSRGVLPTVARRCV